VSTSAVQLSRLVAYLDEYLDIANIPDYPGAVNGLQLENSGGVKKIAACTDACQATIDMAAERGADLMLVHHGLYWGKGLTPLTGRSYRRIRRLLSNDIAVYSAHLPLDAHPELILFEGWYDKINKKVIELKEKTLPPLPQAV